MLSPIRVRATCVCVQMSQQDQALTNCNMTVRSLPPRLPARVNLPHCAWMLIIPASEGTHTRAPPSHRSLRLLRSPRVAERSFQVAVTQEWADDERERELRIHLQNKRQVVFVHLDPVLQSRSSSWSSCKEITLSCLHGREDYAALLSSLFHIFIMQLFLVGFKSKLGQHFWRQMASGFALVTVLMAWWLVDFN